MTSFPPPAEELRFLDMELRQLDARRAQLLMRRAWLVTALQQPVPRAPLAPPRPEASAPRVQNMLLVLGGVLLTIAAIAFTLVSWGHMGIAGRSLVLGAVTLAALGAPVALLKRGLRSTAESVAGLGLALTILDAYALHEVVFTGTDGTAYAALAATGLAALWTAYGLLAVTVSLRLPLPSAVLSAQLPLLLWAIAADAGAYGITAALLVTAGLDTIVALWNTAKSVRLVAAVSACAMGGFGAWAAGWLSWNAAGPSAAARAAALLVLAAVIALGAAWRLHQPVTAASGAVASGLLLVTAVGGILRVSLPADWTVPAHLLCGVALLATWRTSLPEQVRRGFALASAGVQALALLWAVPVVTLTLLGPASWTARAWSGAPSDARAAVTLDTPWPPHAVAVPVVLAVVTAVLLLAVRDTTWRPRAVIAAVTLAWTTVLVLPAVLELPYSATLLIQGGTTVGTLAAIAWIHERAEHRPTAETPEQPTAQSTAQLLTQPTTLLLTLLALLTSLTLSFTALASQTATLTVLSALTALFAGASWLKRLRHLTPVMAPTAFAYAAALAVASGVAAGWQSQHVALLVLAVPVAAALLAARLGDSPATVPTEVTGAVAGLLAVGLAVVDPPMLALVLGLCAVITAGVALRPDRRSVGYASVALFVLAAWVRLLAWRIGVPEAYTLPVTVPALLIGHLRRSRNPRTSSWTAYGPGLAATLLPSLTAAWADPEYLRPLLLGTTALLVTLLGARHRLQAPLVLGGSVLTLVTLHELAPYLVQLTGALPRWAPPALAGLLLLALGATYEQRIRNVRQAREALGKMN
ncbi:SCO7613 C-terminal domain-containing membrane protein [Streptomyces sp. NPDC088794]|uniref:SCO7613 C-terminal domain-containing membrane protein n=1 Tax=Streptomyces sp. NPDC088794 TaxID=3365902 RepID=UPI0038006F37